MSLQRYPRVLLVVFRDSSVLNKKTSKERLAVQGYIQYRISGEPRRLDVDTLNEELKMMGRARMRLQINPDAAHGMIFDFEGEQLSWQ